MNLRFKPMMLRATRRIRLRCVERGLNHRDPAATFKSREDLLVEAAVWRAFLFDTTAAVLEEAAEEMNVPPPHDECRVIHSPPSGVKLNTVDGWVLVVPYQPSADAPPMIRAAMAVRRQNGDTP